MGMLSASMDVRSILAQHDTRQVVVIRHVPDPDFAPGGASCRACRTGFVRC